MAADEGRYARGDIIEQRDHVAQCSQRFVYELRGVGSNYELELYSEGFEYVHES